jgi:hypothetical protein
MVQFVCQALSETIPNSLNKCCPYLEVRRVAVHLRNLLHNINLQLLGRYISTDEMNPTHLLMMRDTVMANCRHNTKATSSIVCFIIRHKAQSLDLTRNAPGVVFVPCSLQKCSII